MSFSTTGTCRSCGAAIIWGETVNGLLMPVDEAPSPNGNVELLAPGDPRDAPFVIIHGDRVAVSSAGVELRLPHHATCPSREKWRLP